jgi:YcaO-like protein with predicted kinase domain
MRSLGARGSNQELSEKLRNNESIVYTDNGNRAVKASAILHRLKPIVPLAGITRIAEISQLTHGKFPVFQSSRPGILLNSSTGQNTGAQGKGLTRSQAKISCLMETLENACMEPRNERLIRGSYSYLRKQHAILPPWLFALQCSVAKPAADEAFMWTQALLLDADESILVPAEAVYFPFQPCDYGTRPAFASTSNGVAAGSTYLEATIHALYEVIERHYCALWDSGKIRAEAFVSKELDTVPDISKFRDATRDEFDLEILALQLPGLKNLPMVVCWLLRPDGAWLYGSGCAPTLDMAIHRAVSEAAQAWSVLESGTREDLSDSVTVTSLRKFPGIQRLTRRAYLKAAPEQYFSDLQDEFRFLKGWLKRAGFPSIALANLARRGLGIPVVRAIVPGLRASSSYGLESTTVCTNAERFFFMKVTR